MDIIVPENLLDGFRLIKNSFSQDNSISFGARGLLLYLFSKSPGWRVQVRDIEREGKLGKDARRTLMREAEEVGYLTFHTGHNEAGRITSCYRAHLEPVPREERTASWETGKLAERDDNSFKTPGAGFPAAVQPDPVQPVAGSAGSGKPGPLINREVPNRERESREGEEKHVSEAADAAVSADLPTDQEAPKKSRTDAKVCACGCWPIFNLWVEIFDKGKTARFSRKRQIAVEGRLAEYGADKIELALRGCKASTFHQGGNDTGTVYDDLELICRDQKHIDLFLRIASKTPNVIRNSGAWTGGGSGGSGDGGSRSGIDPSMLSEAGRKTYEAVQMRRAMIQR